MEYIIPINEFPSKTPKLMFLIYIDVAWKENNKIFAIRILKYFLNWSPKNSTGIKINCQQSNMIPTVLFQKTFIAVPESTVKMTTISCHFLYFVFCMIARVKKYKETKQYKALNKKFNHLCVSA